MTNVDFRDANFIREQRDPRSSEYPVIREFLLMLACCHNIVCNEKGGKIVYDASSPDELALVNFAKFVGIEFVGIDERNNIMILDKNTNEKITYELLHTLEFNSTRKRMSVIVKQKS